MNQPTGTLSAHPLHWLHSAIGLPDVRARLALYAEQHRGRMNGGPINVRNALEPALYRDSVWPLMHDGLIDDKGLSPAHAGSGDRWRAERARFVAWLYGEEADIVCVHARPENLNWKVSEVNFKGALLSWTLEIRGPRKAHLKRALQAKLDLTHAHPPADRQIALVRLPGQRLLIPSEVKLWGDDLIISGVAPALVARQLRHFHWTLEDGPAGQTLRWSAEVTWPRHAPYQDWGRYHRQPWSVLTAHLPGGEILVADRVQARPETAEQGRRFITLQLSGRTPSGTL